jgi:tetratricopeptide (TPR) repeat protein
MLEHVAAMMELAGVAAGQLSDVYDQICLARGRPNLAVPGAAGTDPELLADQALLAERTLQASAFPFAAPELTQIGRALVDAVLAADPALPLARFLLAQLLRTDEDYDSALPIVTALVEEGYDRSEVYRILVHSQDETGHARDALETAIRAERLHPGDVWFPLFQAHLFWYFDEPDRATAPARRAIALDPRIAIGHAVLAKSLAATGEFDEAWTVAVESLVRDPEETGAFTGVAGFGIGEVGIDRIAELTTEALADHPDLLALRIWLAAINIELANLTETRAHFELVLAADPPAPLRALAIECLDMFERPAELAEVYAAFST